jgi:D-alanyl-D-alanine dipeptidase
MHNLVELKAISPRIALDIVYATPNNFIGRAVYSKPCCYLQKKVAKRLHRVQAALEKKGLGLKVWDGYRPHAVTKIFWEFLQDPRYVADPAIGSKHNRGAAVDLTLIDALGRELPMPTLFDDFTEKAHRDYQGGAPEVIRNRQWLEDAMVKEGFAALPTEWWHFEDPDWEKYPILDISFEELE